jgi:hypothetical protein
MIFDRDGKAYEKKETIMLSIGSQYFEKRKRGSKIYALCPFRDMLLLSVFFFSAIRVFNLKLKILIAILY